MEGCPLLTHQGLRAICDASVEQRRPLLGALRVLRLTQAAGGPCRSGPAHLWGCSAGAVAAAAAWIQLHPKLTSGMIMSRGVEGSGMR